MFYRKGPPLQLNNQVAKWRIWWFIVLEFWQDRYAKNKWKSCYCWFWEFSSWMLCNTSFCQIQVRYVGIIFIFQYQVLTTFFPSPHCAVKRFYGVWDSKWPVSDTKYPELKSLVKKQRVRICSERALASSPGLHSPAAPSPHHGCPPAERGGASSFTRESVLWQEPWQTQEESHQSPSEAPN